MGKHVLVKKSSLLWWFSILFYSFLYKQEQSPFFAFYFFTSFWPHWLLEKTIQDKCMAPVFLQHPPPTQKSKPHQKKCAGLGARAALIGPILPVFVQKAIFNTKIAT